MNRTLAQLICCVALIALHPTIGCKNVSSASGSLSYDVDDKLISASITITFRAPPTSATSHELVAAGAREVSSTVWVMPAAAKDYQRALAMSLAEGATLTPND